MVKGLQEQKLLPTLMICDVSTFLGHDSVEQSRTPLPKSMFVHRQAMSLGWQPKLEALFIIFEMHVFYISVSGSPACFPLSLRRQIQHTPHSGRAWRALVSWATERPAKSAAAAIRYCIVDVCGQVGQGKMFVSVQVLTGCLLDDGKINAVLEDATVRCECTVCR